MLPWESLGVSRVSNDVGLEVTGGGSRWACESPRVGGQMTLARESLEVSRGSNDVGVGVAAGRGSTDVGMGVVGGQ